MTKTIETITAKIYLGLKEKHGSGIQNIEELKDFLQKNVNRIRLCLTITPTTFIYKGERETGATIGLINYSRFPETKEELKQKAEEIANLCKDKYQQNKIAIEYQNQTVILD